MLVWSPPTIHPQFVQFKKGHSLQNLPKPKVIWSYLQNDTQLLYCLL